MSDYHSGNYEEACKIADTILKSVRVCDCLSCIIENNVRRFQGWDKCPKCNGTGILITEGEKQ